MKYFWNANKPSQESNHIEKVDITWRNNSTSNFTTQYTTQWIHVCMRSIFRLLEHANKMSEHQKENACVYKLVHVIFVFSVSDNLGWNKNVVYNDESLKWWFKDRAKSVLLHSQLISQKRNQNLIKVN